MKIALKRLNLMFTFYPPDHIPNFEQGAIGFELWSMSEDILFDNILITSEKQAADDYAEKTWKLKKAVRAQNEVGTNVI